MRLVHLSAFSAPYAGSFVPMLVAVLDAARATGWSPDAVFPTAARGRPWLEQFEARDIPTHFVPVTPRADAVRAVRALLPGDDEPALLHSHFTGYDLAASAAAKGRGQVRVVWHAHEFPPATSRARLRRRLKVLLARGRVDAVFCVGHEGAAAITAAGVPRPRVVHVPNAIDVARFPAVTAERRMLARRRVGLPDGVPVVLHFGRDWWLKGGDVFVEAMRRLRESGTEALGVTVWAPDAAREEIARAGAAGYVKVVPPVEDAADLYAAADALVSCSRFEADLARPFTVLEALGSGIGVVVAAPAERVLDDIRLPTHRLVPWDAHSAAQAAAELLGRSPAAAALDAAAAHAWAAAELDLVPYARRTVALYERVRDGAALPARAAEVGQSRVA